MHYRLRTALLLFVLAPFLLIMAVTAWYSLSQLERQADARMQEDIELIARAIRLPLSHALERDRAGGVQQALASAFRIDRVYGVHVYDERGLRVASSGSSKALVDTDRAVGLVSMGDRQGEFEQIGGEEVFSYFVPLTDSGGRINGLLQVTRRGSDFTGYIGELRTQVLIVVLVSALLLSLVLVYGHHTAVGRYLRSIQFGLGRVSKGDMIHRLPLDGPTELRVLARSVNSMLDGIARSQDEIAKRRAKETALEARLYQSEKLAAIGQLAAGVAHELGSPLSVVNGKAQRLLRTPDLTEPVARGLQQIRAQVARMERMVHQLLNFVRRNPADFHLEPADRLAESARGQVEVERRQSNAEIRLEGPDPAPLLWVDRGRMEQALVNLLRNALQACRRQVVLRWFGDAARVGYAVEDDGPGVADDARTRIFDPFFTTKAPGEGTGLGLAIVQAVLNEHGGRIEAGKSVLGGARFLIFLDRPDGEGRS